MRILTWSDRNPMGSITIQLMAHVQYSPEFEFYVLEPGREGRSEQRGAVVTIPVGIKSLEDRHGLVRRLKSAQSVDDIYRETPEIGSTFERHIREIQPDAILVFGASPISFWIVQGAIRAGYGSRVLHVFLGVLEKELGSATPVIDRLIQLVGKSFVSKEVREQVTYVFPSHLCQRTVEELHNVDLPRTAVIPNGVSDCFWHPLHARTPPPDLTFGYVGRIERVKNPSFLLTAADRVRGGAALKVVTDIDLANTAPEGRRLINAIEARHGLLLPPMSQPALRQFYQGATSAILIPSLFESFCNVAVESLVSGAPALLSNRAGCKDVFERYGLGDLIFDIEDVESFDRSLEYARSLSFSIPMDVSRAIYEELSWQRIIGRYNNVLACITGRDQNS